MSGWRAALGKRWEDEASDFLAARGVTIVGRGYRCRLGEIDIVGREGRTLVIVEVRARSSTALVSARESVDRHKRNRILKATRHFLMRHPDYSRHELRFDVIAVDGIDTPDPKLEWIRDAFRAA